MLPKITIAGRVYQVDTLGSFAGHTQGPA